MSNREADLMVTHQDNYENQNHPPPMDEAWWEAVLAEDEALNSNQVEKNFHEYNQDKKIHHKRIAETNSKDWNDAVNYYNEDQVLKFQVNGFNRGGLLVSKDSLQGFVPISHLIDAPCKGQTDEEWLDSYQDRTLKLKVIECDKERGRIVLSERAAQTAPGSRKKILNTLMAGKCTKGIVTNITNFGVFVDLGGVEGLVHLSELSWGRVQHPADVVSIGQLINVFIIHVEKKRARVALSIKRLNNNPWETAEDRYFPGQITEARITSIVPFGIFARVEEGLDGLIHMSKIGKVDRNKRPTNPLKEGQTIRVRVINVDADEQRLGLSLII